MTVTGMTPNGRTEKGTRVAAATDGEYSDFGTFQGWDDDGDAIVLWDENNDEESINAGYLRIVKEG